jgi:hypothetical protein
MAVVGVLGFQSQQIPRQQQEGDAHQSQGCAAFLRACQLQGAGGLQMLGPAELRAATGGS